MRLFIYRSNCTVCAHQDEELLRARGYEVMTVCDVIAHNPNASVSVLMQAIGAAVIQGQQEDPSAVFVFHPDTHPLAMEDWIGFCRAMNVLCVRMDDLPALAPSNIAALMKSDLRTVRRIMLCKEIKEPTVRELVVLCKRIVRQWVAGADRVLGDSLKNPMVREQRAQAKPQAYKLNTTVTTTG